MLSLPQGAQWCSGLPVVALTLLAGVSPAAGFEKQVTVQNHYVNEDVNEQVHTNLLQQRLHSFQGDKKVGRLKFYLNKVAKKGTQVQQAVTQQRTVADPGPEDNIPQTYWHHVDELLDIVGHSTPLPRSANDPPPPPTPLPYNTVFENNYQPLDTRLGAHFLSGLQNQPTPTPPPSQAVTEQQFIAQCPMIMFESNISVRAGSCGENMGKWVDPGLSTADDERVILRWYSKKSAGGLYFGVDSTITGQGSVMFADAKNRIAFRGYYFDLVNCLGVERYTIEESVIKVDQAGQVAASIQNHDVNSDSLGFFYRFTITTGNGSAVARTNLFRLYADQVNFTQVKNGEDTGKVIAMAKRQGDWTADGWWECMSSSSPRGWNINFDMPEEDTGKSVATVQDIRVAIAAAVTIMAYREEGTNPKTGLNATNDWKQFWGMTGSLGAFLLVIILICNCCFVFYWSGIHEKLKKTSFDLEAACLPKRSMKTRMPPVHATY